MAFRSLFAPWRSLSDRAKGAWLWIIDGVWKFTEWYADKSFGDDLFAWVRGKLGVSPGPDLWSDTKGADR
jgi:hypothetical protein